MAPSRGGGPRSSTTGNSSSRPLRAHSTQTDRDEELSFLRHSKRLAPPASEPTGSHPPTNPGDNGIGCKWRRPSAMSAQGDVVTLTRQELYEQVWSTPMRTLARTYGLSDVGLAKICERHDVPRPPQGHWSKLQFGKESPRIPLPPCDDARLEVVRLEAHFTPPEEVPVEKPQLSAPPSKQEQEERIEVRETLADPHPPIERTLRSLEVARPRDDGLVRPRASRCLAIAVSPNLIQRALRIYDALLKALEQRGHKVSASSESGQLTQVVILDETVGIELEEHLERRERPAPPPGPRQRHRFSFIKSPPVEYDYFPAGTLALRIEGAFGVGYRRTWSDGKKTLEAQLNKFMAGLARAADGIKAERTRKELEEQRRRDAERQRQLEEARRAEAERLRREERARAVDLNGKVAAWEEAGRLRAFAAAARAAAAARGESTQPGSLLARWLDWVEQRASMIDPLTTDRPKRCWPPVEGAKVTIKDEGAYSWSGSREVEVPVTAPPLDDTANPAS